MDAARTPQCAGAGRVVCFGEMLMRLSPPGRELPFQTPNLRAHFGGAEGNVAASLAILGHDSAMVSLLPDNSIGRAASGELRRHGVDVAGVRMAPGRMGWYLLASGAMQRPSEVTYDRAGSVFALAPADAYDWPVLLRGARWLHLSGINLAVGRESAAAALSAMRAARQAGVLVSFDCNHRASLWAARASEAPGLLREAMAEATLVFGNARDLVHALGLRAADLPDDGDAGFAAAAARAFAALPRLQLLATAQRLVMDSDRQTLRAHLASRDGALATRPRDIHGIVDRIGSGDAFAAGVLHGLLRGEPAGRLLDFAHAAACLKHSIPGDVNLLPEADMLAFLSGDGSDVRR